MASSVFLPGDLRSALCFKNRDGVILNPLLLPTPSPLLSFVIESDVL